MPRLSYASSITISKFLSTSRRTSSKRSHWITQHQHRRVRQAVQLAGGRGAGPQNCLRPRKGGVQADEEEGRRVRRAAAVEQKADARDDPGADLQGNGGQPRPGKGNNRNQEVTSTCALIQNLLKGDIGHLVSRNESAKLLGSKITKVKIVADDQLKRVTLAHIKDKEEIKLRNEMQKKFSKKLKNVSSYESSSLGRLKRNYADGVVKKQEIFEKLVNSQKIS